MKVEDVKKTTINTLKKVIEDDQTKRNKEESDIEFRQRIEEDFKQKVTDSLMREIKRKD